MRVGDLRHRRRLRPVCLLALTQPCTLGGCCRLLCVRILDIALETSQNCCRQYWTCASEGPKCGFFRWADEPAEQLTLELPPVAAYQGGFDFNDPEDQGHEDVQAPKCQCGLQAVTRTSKSDKNPGRSCPYSCSVAQVKKRFLAEVTDLPATAFQWFLCICREFWTCPRDRDEKCNFFQWIDASATGGQQQPGGALGGSMQRQNEKPWATDQGGPQQKRLKSAANEGIEGDLQAELMINKVKCTCGDPASLLTSNSQKNPGRRFYKCPKPQGEQCRYILLYPTLFAIFSKSLCAMHACNLPHVLCRFFEWEDEMVLDQHGVPTGTTRGGGSFGGGGGGIGGGGGSFGGGGGFGGSNAGGGTKSGNCYICKEPGMLKSLTVLTRPLHGSEVLP